MHNGDTGERLNQPKISIFLDDIFNIVADDAVESDVEITQYRLFAETGLEAETQSEG
ncbi:hypothetical protein TcasGA2_TC034682 [Tribolium castaneum]|uniref:Uncharacterized protein n=1 Tax=Tribolium castaneum TaxID=7070 RepID=A0A139WHQ6_TRICA|nr:hypothetical protein TcasGA2_TC034682 [Tribolium castaneum]